MRRRNRKRGRFARAVLGWRGHILTAALLGAVFLLTRTYQPGVVGPLGTQVPLLIYKACALMIGACIGYWLFVFFADREPDFSDVHDRYQVFGLMCVGSLSMGLAA